MKKVILTNSEVFEIFWQGFIGFEEGLRGVDTLELAVRIAKKLKAVSKEGESNLRTLAKEKVGSVLLLETDEFKHLKRAVIGTPWRPLAAEKVLAALEALDGAENYVGDVNEQGVSEEARSG